MPDINVLLAMSDRDHANHDAATAWFVEASRRGWATCPLTENGFVRIRATPSYTGPAMRPGEVLLVLQDLLRRHAVTHHFWTDSVSLADDTLFRLEALTGHRQVTDTYLLGLCQRHGGTLVTLDAGITTAAIVAPHAEVIQRL
jgi:uncharacterized protein